MTQREPIRVEDGRSEDGTPASPDIFTFTDYRAYLSKYYQYMKATKAYFSYRGFSRIAGLGGKNYLQVVIEGKRNLSPSSISKFIRALRLKKREAAYFEALVLYNQAETDEEHDRYYSELLKFTPPLKLEGITRDQFEYLTRSLHVTLREMAALPDFQDDPAWIARALLKPARPPDIKNSLVLLERLGLLIRGADGHLRHSRKPLATPENIASLEMMQFHRQALSESKEALVQVSATERDISSVTIPMSMKLFPEIIEILRRARADIVQTVNQAGENFDEVFQINMQIFPLTRTKKLQNRGP